MPSYYVTTSFELSDGRVLSCKYRYDFTPGYTWGLPEDCYPEEGDAGEPEYFIEDEEVAISDLPRGLVSIADAMYTADSSDKRFVYKQSEVDYSNFEERSYYDD